MIFLMFQNRIYVIITIKIKRERKKRGKESISFRLDSAKLLFFCLKRKETTTTRK